MAGPMPTRYLLDRPIIDQDQLRTAYSPTNGKSKSPRKFFTKERFSIDIKKVIISLFPIISWLGHYNIKADLVPDIFAGITIAIFQVPQGMAYGSLAGVSPVYGLYTSLFPILIYSLMGTSRHISVGTYAVLSLMAGNVVAKYNFDDIVSKDLFNATANSTMAATTMASSNDVPLTALQIVIVLTFLSGLFQLAFGILRLGSLSVFLSPPLVSSFTCGAAFHVFTSQVPTVLGINIPKTSGPLTLVYTYIDVFTTIKHATGITMIFSACSILILFIVKEYIAPLLKKKTRIPFPIELIMLILGTVLASSLNLKDEYSLDTVGDIPNGIPPPVVPQFHLIKDLAVSAFVISIVALTSSLSMAKIFAKKHDYEINPNQELIALGSANIFGSFFNCIPATGSLARSSVQEGSGGKTQLVSLINCVGIIIVVMFLASSLYYLPKAILASIIMVSLKGLILQVTDIVRLWKLSYIDASIWIVTFASVILLDVDYGLGVGIIYSLITLIWRSQKPTTKCLGYLNSANLYVPLDTYLAAQEIPRIKIIQYVGPIHFGNSEFFIDQITKMSCLKERLPSKIFSPDNLNIERKQMERKISNISNLSYDNNGYIDEEPSLKTTTSKPVTYLILECGGWIFMDTTGVQALKQLCNDLSSKGMILLLANIPYPLTDVFQREKIQDVIPLNHQFPTVHDAVLFTRPSFISISKSYNTISPSEQFPNSRAISAHPSQNRFEVNKNPSANQFTNIPLDGEAQENSSHHSVTKSHTTIQINDHL